MLRVQCVSGFMYKKMTKRYANTNIFVTTLVIVILVKIIVILVFDLPTRQLAVTGL